jgi:hypothetical protein
MARRVFLERRTYRMNRLQDAARLLPVLGMILFFGPVFISDDGGASDAHGAGAGLAEWLVYCFVVWLLLIAMTMLVNRALAQGERRPQGRGGETRRR